MNNLSRLYLDIVEPMDDRLKRIVCKLSICSESEIFASNLEFRVFLHEEH